MCELSVCVCVCVCVCDCVCVWLRVEGLLRRLNDSLSFFLSLTLQHVHSIVILLR